MSNCDGYLILTSRCLQLNDELKKRSKQQSGVAKGVATRAIVDMAQTIDVDNRFDVSWFSSCQNHYPERLAKIAVAFVTLKRNFLNSCRIRCELAVA
jgi:hypothetical protein